MDAPSFILDFGSLLEGYRSYGDDVGFSYTYRDTIAFLELFNIGSSQASYSAYNTYCRLSVVYDSDLKPYTFFSYFTPSGSQWFALEGTTSMYSYKVLLSPGGVESILPYWYVSNVQNIYEDSLVHYNAQYASYYSNYVTSSFAYNNTAFYYSYNGSTYRTNAISTIYGATSSSFYPTRNGYSSLTLSLPVGLKYNNTGHTIFNPIGDPNTSAYSDGYNNGYADGALSTENPIGALISGTIDSGFNVVERVLDFDLFGFNLKGIAFSLITISLVFALARFLFKLLGR